MPQTNLWNKVQVVFTILTPLVLGVGGFFINSAQHDISNSISRLEQTVSSVEAMRPYFDMLAGNNPAQAKMAAYALYMLNKEDPEMTVSLILAANRKELNDVLKDIGNRDANILAIVSKAIISKEGERTGSAPKSEIEASAKNIIQSISAQSSGWSYLGTFGDKKWSGATIRIANELPEEGKAYVVVDDIYLRDSKPKFPLYKLGKILGVIKAGEKIRIDTLEDGVGKNRVWAQVSVVGR